jgi:hypothetical protein
MKKVYLSDQALFDALTDIFNGETPSTKTLTVLLKKQFLVRQKKRQSLRESVTPLAHEFREEHLKGPKNWFIKP